MRGLRYALIVLTFPIWIVAWFALGILVWPLYAWRKTWGRKEKTG